MSEAENEGTSQDLAARRQQIAVATRAILDGEIDEGFQSDPEVVSRMILERILNAETFEDAFAPQTLDPWREALMDVPVQVAEFRFNRSGFKAGSPIYAVVDLTRLDTGEQVTVTCGGRNVLAQLLVALKNGWTDRPVAMTSKETSEGNQVLWLVPAEHLAEKAAAQAATEGEVPF